MRNGTAVTVDLKGFFPSGPLDGRVTSFTGLVMREAPTDSDIVCVQLCDPGMGSREWDVPPWRLSRI